MPEPSDENVSLKISIVTAVYNNREVVVDAIESILAQSFSNVELVLIDGGSTDGTLDALATYRDRISVLTSEPDGGIYDALNKGIRLASGDVVGFLHSDDLLADEHALKRVADAFTDPEVDAVYGDLVYVRRGDPTEVVRYWRAGEFTVDVLGSGWMPPHPTFYVRRHLYDRLGGFDVTYRIAADYDCMLRFLTKGIRVKYLPHLLVKMRMGGASNRSIGNMLLKSREDYRALKQNRIGALRALIGKNLRKLPQFFVR